MQAFFNCTVKMFGNCKQTGHLGKDKGTLGNLD